MESSNLRPIFSDLIDRNAKEKLLQQKSLSIWFIGLSGSGKSTLAFSLENYLFNNGFKTVILDGDNVRTGLNKDLGFTLNDRTENIRRIAEINKILLDNGLIVINSFVCPTESLRKLILEILGIENVYLVFVKASLETCVKRDVKGFYKKALNNEIKNFTGISDIFEEPSYYNLVLDTENLSREESLSKLISEIYPKLKL